MKTVKFENGNKEVEMTIVNSNEWKGGENSRIYHELSFTNRRITISSFYEILEGKSSDETFEVNGKKYGFKFGVDCNSHTKRDLAKAALMEMVA